jgi:ADP-ribose pyrophosphatase
VRVSDDLTIPDWPIVRTLDYVNVMVVNEDGQLMVLEGYKHGLGRSSWQVVGGYLEPGEEAMAAAQRELLEETGYHSDSWSHLGTFVVDANRYVGQGHFFLARHARCIADPDHDDLETFTVDWVSPAEMLAALFDGRVGVMGYAINIALGLLALKQSPD